MDISIGQGKGMFLWQRAITAGGNLDQIIQQTRAMNLSHVEIKIADGQGLYPSVEAKWGSDVIGPLVEALHGLGVQVWVWQYIYNYQPEAEADYVFKRIQYYGHKITGLIVDAEWECKVNAAAAPVYMKRLRANLGYDFPIGISSYRFPTYHPQLNWRAFAQYADMWWPQVYWEQAHNPAAQLKRCMEEHMAIKCMPLVPIGSCYHWNGWSASVADLNEFDQAVKRAGLRGESWWVWNMMNERQEWYRAICAHEWKGPFSGEAPKPPDEPKARYKVLPRIGMKLRAGPSVNYPRLAGIPYNTIVTVEYIEKYQDSAWAKVTYKGITGWVCMWQGSPDNAFIKEVVV